MAKTAAARTPSALLRAYAMSFPEAHEDKPWGESAFKVRGKTFLFMHEGPGGLSLSTKLPDSCTAALMFPFAEPTGYGLGKSGWVTARFDATDDPPLALLREWIDESYRAVAPKKLAAALPGYAAETASAARSRAAG
jgi:predicted DNA-binding protein (MmcQ/YjbR family)